MSSLTKLALKRPVSALLIVLALFVFGISSVFGFKMELTPDLEMPMLFVMTIFQGGDLFSAQSGHVPIIPPKNSAVQVALGLGVTDKIDSGHRGGPFFPGMI